MEYLNLWLSGNSSLVGKLHTYIYACYFRCNDSSGFLAMPFFSRYRLFSISPFCPAQSPLFIEVPRYCHSAVTMWNMCPISTEFPSKKDAWYDHALDFDWNKLITTRQIRASTSEHTIPLTFFMLNNTSICIHAHVNVIIHTENIAVELAPPGNKCVDFQGTKRKFVCNRNQNNGTFNGKGVQVAFYLGFIGRKSETHTE